MRHANRSRDIRERMRDRSRYNGTTDRFLVRAHLSGLDPPIPRPLSSLPPAPRLTFGCHLCRAMECTGPDSTPVPCFRFIRRQWETRLRDMNEWILPSPGWIPLRAGSAAGTPLPRWSYLIPGVSRIPWATSQFVLIFPPIKLNSSSMTSSGGSTGIDTSDASQVGTYIISENDLGTRYMTFRITF